MEPKEVLAFEGLQVIEPELPEPAEPLFTFGKENL